MQWKICLLPDGMEVHFRFCSILVQNSEILHVFIFNHVVIIIQCETQLKTK